MQLPMDGAEAAAVLRAIARRVQAMNSKSHNSMQEAEDRDALVRVAARIVQLDINTTQEVLRSL